MTRILTIIALLFATPMLAACVSAVTIKENKSFGLKFAKNISAFQWKPFGAFPVGQSFQLIALDDGRNAVVVGNYSITAVVTSFQTQRGIILDKNGCSTGEFTVRFVNSDSISVYQYADGVENPPIGICFKSD